MSTDIPNSLSETVRLYASGLINHHGIRPFEYPKKGDVKEVAFGIEKPVKKSRKKRRIFTAAPGLLASLHAGGRQVSKTQLAKLATDSLAAMQEADELAGEPVVYCCGKLRLRFIIGDVCTCKENLRYTIINSRK
jgi:hypothetical protein